MDDELCIDFTVTTKEGSDRILRAAFDYASKSEKQGNGSNKGEYYQGHRWKIFWNRRKIIAKEYLVVVFDDWYVDIMAAKLLDTKRRDQFKVIVLPNLYGDILTDEAAELQGGVGTAGSANVGKKYAMFEAIHGFGAEDGRRRQSRCLCRSFQHDARSGDDAGTHRFYAKKQKQLSSALDQAVIFEKKVKIA